MNNTDIETRYGLIIENAVAEALRRADISFVQGHKYDPACEKPDFLIPDSERPKYIIECHQTDDRESLKMKILRLLSAVFEAKVFYGKEIISVNLLFGNIDILPGNNLDTFCCFYDVNLFPRESQKYAAGIKSIEECARRFAEDEKHNTASALSALREQLPHELDELAQYLKEALAAAGGPKEELFPIWEKEAQRVLTLGECPRFASYTAYKPTILRSLLLKDGDFAELLECRDPNRCGESAKRQMVLTGIAARRESTARKYRESGFLDIDSEFSTFINDPYAMSLRSLCREQLAKDRRLWYFFEDIRDGGRRAEIARAFIALVNRPPEEFREALLDCLVHGSCHGVEHGRCWIADLMPLAVGESHNAFNRRMMANPHYRQALGNPFSNMAIRSPRLGTDPDAVRNYSEVAAECFFSAVKETGTDLSALSPEALADKLFAFRKDGLIKLQKLNPLYIAIESIAESLHLTASYKGIKSVISDLSTGKFDLYEISDGEKRVLVNALYVAPTYGSDHKANEWSARRRAIGYRRKKGVITEEKRYSDFVFVVDGAWTEKSIRKLFRAGWNNICELGRLEETLRRLFEKNTGNGDT